RPAAASVTWSTRDLIGLCLRLGPADVPRRNPVRGDEFPCTSVTGNVYDSGSYQEALDRLLAAADYAALRRAQVAARAAGRCVGIGLSCFLDLTGPGAGFYGVGGAPIAGQEGTTIRLEPSGAVTVLTGVPAPGKGRG